MTKEERKEYNKQYKQKNKSKYIDSNKIYMKSYRADNTEYMKSYLKTYKENNKDKINELNRKYKSTNKQKIKEYQKEYQKTYNRIITPERKEKKRKYVNKMLESNPLFKLNMSIRTTIKNSFRYLNSKKCKKSHDILGCTTLEFKEYLESKFEPWMTWENKGLYNGELNYGWDIDHKIPISSATCEEDIIKLNHFTNLQPLCSKINRDIKRNN